MADRIDLAAMADEMDNAADVISKATAGLRGITGRRLTYKSAH